MALFKNDSTKQGAKAEAEKEKDTAQVRLESQHEGSCH